MARKINSRQIKQPQKRVIGAGITEFWYLKHLKPLLGFVYEMKPRYFGNESMDNINKLIDEELTDGAEVICFFDEDVSQWNPEEGRQIKELHRKYDDNERITHVACLPLNIGSYSTTRRPIDICAPPPMPSMPCISISPNSIRRRNS